MWHMYHRQLFNSLFNWYSTGNWMIKMGTREALDWMRKVTRQLRASHGQDYEPAWDKLTPSREEMPPFHRQFANVIPHNLTYGDVEQIAAEVLNQALLAHMGQQHIILWRPSNGSQNYDCFAARWDNILSQYRVSGFLVAILAHILLIIQKISY
ncbi:hypothetical protein BGZ63DRAFT_197150 [Mariannaea sp. PMI_226]|nr:hypothetical protein BGZ63DRAFT_197150 [Mariannaea sp. PMI_226]